MSLENRAFVSYLDENDIKREGWFVILETTGILFKLQGKHNIITVPASRILKIKEKVDGERDFE